MIVLLLFIVPPSSPNVTFVEAISSSSLSIMWTPPLDDGGSSITSYTIEYRPIESTDPFQSVSVSGSNLNTLLQELIAYTFYDIRIFATNIAGNGNPSDLYTPTVQTHPSSPTAPENLLFVSNEQSTLDLSWNTPVTLNGILGVYQLLVSTDGIETYNEILFVDQYTITGQYNYTNIILSTVYYHRSV